MKISLSLRLFLVHLGYTLAFTAVAGVITVRIVEDGYSEYTQNVQEQIATFGVETEFMPMAEEVALSLLRASAGEFPEVNEQRRREISAGLVVVLRGVPIVRSFLLLDQDKRIDYATPPDKALDLMLLGAADQEFLANEQQSRRQIVEPGGAPATQLTAPTRAPTQSSPATSPTVTRRVSASMSLT